MSKEASSAELDALLGRLRGASGIEAPRVYALLDELQTRLEIELGAARREAADQVELLEQAEEQRRRYEQLFEQAPGAYLVTDGHGKILAANRAAAELLGGTGRRLEGRLLVSFVGTPDRSAFRRSIVKIARGDEIVHLALSLAPGTAGERAVLATARPTAADDTSLRVYWLLVDRTEVAEAERELAADGRLTERLMHTNLERLQQAYRELELERGRLQRVLARFPEGLVALDRELQVLFANAPARRILFPFPLRHGDPLPDRWDSFRLRDYAAELFQPRGPLVERRLDLEDGRVIAVNGIPHRAGGDAFLLLSDVTAVTRRTQTEREFVRNAAHELRTPLTAISTAIEVLQRGAKEIPEDRDRFLDHIERQSKRLARLTQSLLVLARAQAGEQPPRLEFVPLLPLLDDVASTIRPPDGVEVVVDCAADLALFVDRDLAEHAILNLAVNAARHTRHGSVRLIARGVGERRVEIEVADDGEGILPEQRERLGDPFYRGGARDSDGFGLGLAISSQAIAVLGGTLELESEPGLGTRAIVTLPSARLVRT